MKEYDNLLNFPIIKVINRINDNEGISLHDDSATNDYYWQGYINSNNDNIVSLPKITSSSATYGIVDTLYFTEENKFRVSAEYSSGIGQGVHYVHGFNNNQPLFEVYF